MHNTNNDNTQSIPSKRTPHRALADVRWVCHQYTIPPPLLLLLLLLPPLLLLLLLLLLLQLPLFPWKGSQEALEVDGASEG